MGTQRVNLAVIIKNPLNDAEFLLTKQTLPPKFNDPEDDLYQDSDLWDLPAAQLSLLDRSLTSSQAQFEIEGNSLAELLNQFDVDSAVHQVVIASYCSLVIPFFKNVEFQNKGIVWYLMILYFWVKIY